MTFLISPNSLYRFADDTVLFLSNTDLTNLINELNKNLVQCSVWLILKSQIFRYLLEIKMQRKQHNDQN